VLGFWGGCWEAQNRGGNSKTSAFVGGTGKGKSQVPKKKAPPMVPEGEKEKKIQKRGGHSMRGENGGQGGTSLYKMLGNMI